MTKLFFIMLLAIIDNILNINKIVNLFSIRNKLTLINVLLNWIDKNRVTINFY